MRQKDWTDNLGKTVSRLEVVADNVQILSAPLKEPVTKGLPSMDPQPDDLPF